MGRFMFISLELPCLNKGVTLSHFQSSGNMPVVKEQLKILQKETQIKSARSRISLADILSRPVAFDWLIISLFDTENT